MNDKRPALGEQLIRSLLLSFAAMWAISYFFGWPGQPKQEDKPARDPQIEKRATLEGAFGGLSRGELPTSDAAKTEISSLEKEIAKSDAKDPYTMWAHLRSALLQQYVLKDWSSAVKNYDVIINHGTPDAIDAQAIFQKGDWQWFNATESPLRDEAREAGGALTAATVPAPTRAEAAATLETLIHRGRTASTYLDTQIYVPILGPTAPQVDAAKATRDASGGFELKRVNELKGTLVNPAPQGVLDRINAYYSTTFLNRSFDMLVQVLGANPAYSYGLAIIFLAIILRVVMQPINRRQYESTRGMAVLGPEMKKIQEKNKAKPSDSPQAQREKQMKSMNEVRELQKAHGVNPQVGCALALVQLPVFFFVINPLMMHYEPKMALVGASFGWIASLALPDYPLLALYGLSMLVSFRLSATPATDDMQKQMQMITTFVMPVMLPFFMKGFSAAFILYWISFNLVSMIFQYRMMKATDPDKSVIKTLMGQSSLVPAVGAVNMEKTDAVPPRPKNAKRDKSRVNERGNDKVKTLMPVEESDDKVSGKTVKKVAASDIVSSNGAPHHNGHAQNGDVSNGDNSDNDEASKSGKNRGNAAQRARRRRRY